jgi:myo-inositol-1(or 4)-monophosphatase
MQKSHFKKLAVNTALKAGAYIRKKVGRVKDVRYKGEINIVTEVDKKAEGIIISAIKKSYPSHDFLAEESAAALTPKKASEFKWVIDPLDGTTNFLHSFPFFCVSIALEYKGRLLVGAVYDPARDELFHAEKGRGAFLNKKKIHVSRTAVLKKALLATGFAYDVKRVMDNNLDNFAKFIKASQAVRRAGSAALDLCYVASGRFDGFWESGLNPWDSAAAALILEEAGGKITRFDGSKYTIYDKQILASNSKIHSQMIRTLSK